MKVGILTYHRSHNYGAYLQAYSLSHKLNSIKGIECEIINYNLKSEDEIYKKVTLKKLPYYFIYKKQDRMFNKILSKQLLSNETILDDNFEKVLEYAEKKYDIVIAGSDEIWHIGTRGFPNAYWLPGKRNFIKVSYAASGRNSEEKLTDEVKKMMKIIYEDFNYLGVRDEITGKQICELSNKIKTFRNCDPSCLYENFKEKNDLKRIICNKYKLDYNKKIIAIIYDRINIISKLRKKLGKDYQFICLTRPMINADKNLCSITPFEWVDVIGGADYVISSYFHGMMFAFNQNTPFIALDRRANSRTIETSKMYDFLNYTNLKKRYYLGRELTDSQIDEISKMILKDLKETVDFSIQRKKQVELFDEFVKDLFDLNEREKKIN